jgi:hypothetical protein
VICDVTVALFGSMKVRTEAGYLSRRTTESRGFVEGKTASVSGAESCGSTLPEEIKEPVRVSPSSPRSATLEDS